MRQKAAAGCQQSEAFGQRLGVGKDGEGTLTTLDSNGGTRMFRLDDRTRRRLHLALFALVGLVPTAGLLGWAAWVHSPWYAAGHAERLAWRLGLEVVLDRVRHPRPGVTIYEGLELREPANGQPLVRCQRLEARWQLDADFAKQTRRFLVLKAPGIEVFPLHRAEWSGLLDRLLACRLGWPEACVQLEAAEVTLAGQPNWPKLAGVQARFESLPRGTWVGVAFPSGEASGRLATISFSRQRQSAGSGLHVRLDTGQGEVPCRLLALGWPELAACGPQARFAGTVEADHTAGAWEAQVAGHFADVDLEGLVTQRFSWTLSGKAQVFLDQARIRRSRLEQATGWVVMTRGGAVSRALLEAAGQHLAMTLSTHVTAEPIQPFEQLGFWFAIDQGQIRIRGRCPLDRPDGTAVVLGRQGPLLVGSDSNPLPLAQVARLFAPAEVVELPISAETAWLVERVAVIPKRPAVASQPQAPHVR